MFQAPRGPRGREADHDIGPATLGEWHDFVYHIRVADDGSGLWQVWHNATSDRDAPVIDYAGPVYLGTSERTLGFKIGIYRGRLGTAGEDHAEYFYDAIRIGDAALGANFESVRPGL